MPTPALLRPALLRAALLAALLLALAAALLATATGARADDVPVAPVPAAEPVAEPVVPVVPAPVPATTTPSATPTATVSPAVARAQAVLKVAASLKGRPYRYGATGPNAFDCSGYVRYVYAKAVGTHLPRTSRQQYAASTKVAKTAKRAGDLVFTRSRGRVVHVGIYAGDGRFWVAPKTGDVVKLQRIYTSDYVVGRV